jgi:hypothetical protein
MFLAGSSTKSMQRATTEEPVRRVLPSERGSRRSFIVSLLETFSLEPPYLTTTMLTSSSTLDRFLQRSSVIKNSGQTHVFLSLTRDLSVIVLADTTLPSRFLSLSVPFQP